LVIKGHKSSTAESYAKEENISFKVVKHTYEWVTTEEATYFASGTSSYQCPLCGKVSKTETIETLKLKTPKATITSVSKGISVKYKKVADATGFQVKYTLGKKSVTKTYKSTESVTEKISGLKKGSYKVQVRAYVASGKKKAYSSWSKAKSINVK
jgi:hypothetical protein